MAVNYNKTTWTNNGPPAINAEKLNNIESGIENCAEQIKTNTDNIATNTSNIQMQGSTLANVSNEVDQINNQLSLETITFNAGQWQNKIPNASTGELNNTNQRICTNKISFPSIAKYVVLIPANGYKVAYYKYGDNVYEHYYWYPTITGISNIIDLTQDTNEQYIIGLAKADDAVISPSDSSNLTIQIIPKVNLYKDENMINFNNYEFGWEYGTLNPGSGSESSSQMRLRSKYILAGAGTVLKNLRKDGHLIYCFNLDKTYKSDISWTTNNIVVQDDCYIRILLKKSDNTTITSDDFVSLINEEVVYRQLPSELFDVISDNFKDQNPYPSYFDTQIQSAITDSRNATFDAGVNGDSFVFITDLHWPSNQKHSPALVKKVVDELNVDKVICGGDLINGGAKQTNIDAMSDCINSFKNNSKFYCLFGNHDSNTIGTGAVPWTKNNAYTLMQKQSDLYVDEYAEPCYFYFDNEATKTRYICLDTGVESDTISSDQRTWMNNSLNSMPNGWHALIFAHIVYKLKTGKTWSIGLQPEDLEPSSSMIMIFDDLDQWNETQEQSEPATHRKVEAVFGGHVHIDCNYSTDGGIPIVLTNCDCGSQTFTETSSGSGIRDYEAGTITEQCFDITTINYDAKEINCIRVGRGSNRAISYS